MTVDQNSKELPEDELNIHVEENEEGLFIARVMHMPTMTIKISDLFHTKDEAVKHAKEELFELVSLRGDGLGN